MKITELLNENVNTDDAPNITVQFKKSMDVAGNYPILFANGKKEMVPVADMVAYLNHYDELKPFEREEIQKVAGQSLEKFNNIIEKIKQ